jgi:hypothetical protein
LLRGMGEADTVVLSIRKNTGRSARQRKKKNKNEFALFDEQERGGPTFMPHIPFVDDTRPGNILPARNLGDFQLEASRAGGN